MKRKKSREIAVQLLFAAEAQEQNPARLAEIQADRLVRDYYASFGQSLSKDHVDETHLMRLLQGTLSNVEELDEKIESASKHWKLYRMTRIDRNILRLGAYELLFIKDTPPKVVLDEAVELAKKFGSEDSFAFINGILDHLSHEKA